MEFAAIFAILEFRRLSWPLVMRKSVSWTSPQVEDSYFRLYSHRWPNCPALIPYSPSAWTDTRFLSQTTLPNFRNKNCEVRRRYNDFVWLRAHIKEKMDERGKRLTIAELPGNSWLSMFGTGTCD